jgi:hypothetical protein
MYRIAFTLVLAFLLNACASDLFVKGNQEASIRELLRTMDACHKNLLGDDYKKLVGKLFFDPDHKLTSADLSNQQMPSLEEASVISKLVSNQTFCEIRYLNWSQEHAPKASQLTMVYSSLNIEIFKRLSTGAYSYGQALSDMRSAFIEYWKHLKLLEINVSENNKEATKQFLRNYLLQSGSQNSTDSNGNLIVRCGSRGVNFVTNSCN